MKANIISSILSLIIFLISSIGGCSSVVDAEPDYDYKKGVDSNSYEYNIPSRYYSDGIKNIVKRSRQIKEISWMPVETLDAFNSDYVFEKGIEVVGIPYSQPVNNGKFVIYQMTLDEFVSESKVKGGVFYSEKGLYEEPSTYYGMDCSSFVSYAWNCKNRLTAKNLSEFGDYIGTSINKIQVGDALIKTGEGSHAVLVTGVKEDSKKNVVWIEISEQTPPITKRTCYGKGELFSISEFLSFYLKNGFKIYRNTDFRDNTPFLHTCSSPIGEFCDNCYLTNNHKSLSLADIFADNYFFEVQFATLNNEEVSFAYSISYIFWGTEKYETDSEHYIKLRNEPGGEETILLVPPKTFVTIFDKVYDSSGELWGKTKYNNKVGWLYLESSEFLGGEVTPGKEVSLPSDNYEIIDTERSVKAYRAFFPIAISDFPIDKKIQVYAFDSSGNKYLVGEYVNR